MLIAVIGGAHASVSALEAALAHIDELGIHTVLCTGNLAVGHGDANEVINILRTRRVTCVQGELDRLVVRAVRKANSLRKRFAEDEFDALQRTHESLASGNIEFLRALPHRIMLTLEGKGVCLCHGSVTSQNNVLSEDDPLDHFRRQREAANCDVVLCGSDIKAFVSLVDQALFVNPGRLDATDCTASFVVVNTDEEPLAGEIVRVR